VVDCFLSGSSDQLADVIMIKDVSLHSSGKFMNEYFNDVFKGWRSSTNLLYGCVHFLMQNSATYVSLSYVERLIANELSSSLWAHIEWCAVYSVSFVLCIRLLDFDTVPKFSGALPLVVCSNYKCIL